MRHVFIIATARTGGTWFGKVLDTSPHVKYIWEPDSHRRPMQERLRQWPLEDEEALRKVIEGFKPHQAILPAFSKKRITTAVYKLTTVCIDVAFVIDQWVDEFLDMREKLDAKVIHLLRHPVRFAASLLRWGDRPLRTSLDLYGERDRAFFDHSSGAPWYKAVKHEDATQYPRMVFPSVFSFCMMSYTKELFDFFTKMHAEDKDPEPDDHSTTMSKETVLNRWREMDPSDLVVANEMTHKYWEGIYEPLGVRQLEGGGK